MMGMMSLTWIRVLMALPIAGAVEVSVEPLSGPTRAGALVALSDRQLVFEADTKQETLDLRDLLTRYGPEAVRLLDN